MRRSEETQEEEELLKGEPAHEENEQENEDESEEEAEAGEVTRRRSEEAQEEELFKGEEAGKENEQENEDEDESEEEEKQDEECTRCGTILLSFSGRCCNSVRSSNE